MNRPTTGGDWDRWSDQWRGAHVADAEPATLIARTARARRAMLGLRVLSIGITVVALLIVAAALYHAANILELILGLCVGAGISGAWMIDRVNQRNAHEHADAPPIEYLTTRRALCTRRIRFAHLVWVLAALDLVFLLPWWIGGIKFHGFGFGPMHLMSVWGPLALIVGMVVVGARIRSAAAAELESLASIDRYSDLS